MIDFSLGLIRHRLLADEPAQHRADGLVLPLRARDELSDNLQGREGMLAPENFHDHPFGLGDFRELGHGACLLRLYAISQVQAYDMQSALGP